MVNHELVIVDANNIEKHCLTANYALQAPSFHVWTICKLVGSAWSIDVWTSETRHGQ